MKRSARLVVIGVAAATVVVLGVGAYAFLGSGGAGLYQEPDKAALDQQGCSDEFRAEFDFEFDPLDAAEASAPRELMVADPRVGQDAALVTQGGTESVWGDVFALPPEQDILQVMPMCVQRADSGSFEELLLHRVAVLNGDVVVMAGSLGEAVAEICEVMAGDATHHDLNGASPELRDAVTSVEAALNDVQAAVAGNDPAAMGVAVAALEKAVADYEAAGSD